MKNPLRIQKCMLVTWALIMLSIVAEEFVIYFILGSDKRIEKAPEDFININIHTKRIWLILIILMEAALAVRSVGVISFLILNLAMEDIMLTSLKEVLPKPEELIRGRLTLPSREKRIKNWLVQHNRSLR